LGEETPEAAPSFIRRATIGRSGRGAVPNPLFVVDRYHDTHGLAATPAS
jgi:hypothetical protein